MKRIKKAVSIVLAMAMVFAMSLTAFAGSVDQNTVKEDDARFAITVDNQVEGYEYEAYQIFSGKFANGTLSDIVWGTGVTMGAKDVFPGNSKFAGKTAKEIAAGLEGNSSLAVEFADAVAKYLAPANAVKDTFVSGTGYVIGKGAEEGKGTLTPGYYLVQNTKVPVDENNEEQGTAYTRYILEVVGNVTTNPKSSVPSSDKKILDDINGDGKEEETDTNEASIGDLVKYQITGRMPSTLDDYKSYYYVFNDTLSKGLKVGDGTELKNGTAAGIKVEVQNPGQDAIEVTNYFYRHVSAYDEKDGTKITVGIKDIKALNMVSGWDSLITKDSVIVVTYSAVLDKNAEVNVANKNDVVLKYDNDPNHVADGDKEPPKENPDEPDPNHPSGVTPKKEVETYTTQLTITKLIEDTANVLPGAEFTLTGTGVNIVLITEEKFQAVPEGQEPEEGKDVYYKLKNGTYTTTPPVLEDTEEVKNNRDDYADYPQKYTKEVKFIAKDNKTAVNVVGVIGSDGKVTFIGLGAGKDYKLEETKVPDGYNKCDDVEFGITFDYKNKEFASTNNNITLNGLNGLETTIRNYKGSTLPSTGGIGTTIFYVVGGILVVGAGILLVTKRRMKAQ